MVAEMSKHDAEFIMRKMSYARGLQFRTCYWLAKGIELESGVESSPLNAIIE